MSRHAANQQGRNGPRKGRNRYDKELVRGKTTELLAIRLGPGTDQGARLVWDCPACGKQDKYSVKRSERRGGCMVEACRLSGYDDVFGMLAKLEELDYHADFLSVLARAYELLGVEPPADGCADTPANAGVRKKGAGGQPQAKDSSKAALRVVPVPQRASGSKSGGPRGRGEGPLEDLDARLSLASRVYGQILELCPLETRDRHYLRTRGLSYETINKGRFGTMTAGRARHLKGILQREFGREELLSVPGFSEDTGDGRLKFTLTGDYLLIPYHDARGSVTTIEGRCVGEPPEGMGKYVSLRRAGNHLYLFPGHRPEDVLAVCEGAMGAIVAADCGFAVGAIMGCERFRASSSPEMLDGNPGEPLLELKGADFGGRTVPYIPDADDPPNPNVLKAAPKAARWVTEPQNGQAAVCLLPAGADLDEWLLSLPQRSEERRARFAGLLAGANPPEDGVELSPAPIPKNGVPRNGGTGRGGRSPDGNVHSPSNPIRGNKERPMVGDSVSQPGLWEEVASGADVPEAKAAATGGTGGSERRGVSRGARRLRDEVYRAMMEALPPKKEHLEALEKKGIMPATARVGCFASLDVNRVERVAADLTGRFGAKRLLSVPGFEPAGAGTVRLSLASRSVEEYVLVPCFDAEGLLSGVEALTLDRKTGDLELEETVPLGGAGSHLYVFAHYEPGQVEGFCEGILGALLAAQEDVAVGAIGGFRRYRSASGPAGGRQPVDAVLPELEGVDFAGRTIAYVPRAGVTVGDGNARYHEAVTAARWLVERQNGRPAVAGLRNEGETGGDRSAADPGGPTSLGEWILSLPEDKVRERLRKLFPENPVRNTVERNEDYGEARSHNDEEDSPPPLPSSTAYGALALAASIAALLDTLLIRLESLAGHVVVGSGGEHVLYAGTLGPLRRLVASAPFDVLCEPHATVALVTGLVLSLVFAARARRYNLARWSATRMRLERRWKLHLASGKATSARFPVTPGEALAAVLSWPLAFVFVGWITRAAESLLPLADHLGVAAHEGIFFADPTLISVGAATLFSAFVLWRRRSIRVAEERMLRGKIRH